jgi:NRAMP (natural resistance-associated macrophage protein)-like metal ion transporter
MLLWVCAEISIVTCDMQAIITSAIAFRILFGFPLWVGCLLTCLDVVTFVVLELREYHSVEYLFVFLVSVMAVSSAAVGFEFMH